MRSSYSGFVAAAITSFCLLSIAPLANAGTLSDGGAPPAPENLALNSDSVVLPKAYNGKQYFATGIPAKVGKVRQIAVGSSHTCAIQRTNSQVVCWGWNGNNRVASGNKLKGIVAISGSANHTCGFNLAGKAYCWGWNAYEQASVPRDLPPVYKIAAGYMQTCAILRTTYKIRCWGGGQKPDPNVMFSDVSVGLAGGCGVQYATNNVICWGSSARNAKSTPAAVGSSVYLSVGVLNGCVIQRQGLRPKCWGYNSDGQIRPPANAQHMWGISLGTGHACGVTYDRGQTLRCWGSNLYGQLDHPQGLSGVRSVSSGWLHSCAIKQDYSAVCWGHNARGRVTGIAPAIPASNNLSHSTAWPIFAPFAYCSSSCKKGAANSYQGGWSSATWRSPQKSSGLVLGTMPGSFVRFGTTTVKGYKDRILRIGYSWRFIKDSRKSYSYQIVLMLV